MKTNSLKTGFTLVEVLVVVIILSLLAGIIIPQFSSATNEARNNMLKEDLRTLRSQIGVYQAQHWGVSPGLDADGNPSAEVFVNQMTKFSNEHGDTADIASEEFCYGPYFQRIPKNPVNDRDTVNVLAALPDAPPNADGWIFVPSELILRADAPGTDAEGREYYSY